MADTDKKGWLDRTRDFCQHYGDELGRFWEQDGKHFNFDGSPWKPAKERAADAKAAPVAAPAPAAPTADDQLSQQLKG